MSELSLKGIIIRKTNFGDNDVIFDVLANDGHVVGFFGRGARKIKSKFSGVIQLGMVIKLNYSIGKNLNYPTEISIDNANLFSFYSKTTQNMNFYTDILSVARGIAKDMEDSRIFDITLRALNFAQDGEDLYDSYNEFLTNMLELIGVDTRLKCYFSGELINDKEFYYQHETNKVISIANKPKSIDAPMIVSDKVFVKGFLKRLVYEHINHRMVLKF